MSQEQHFSVLLSESVDALDIKEGGRYVDGTFGRGGHSAEIMARLNGTGHLQAFDKDPEAIDVAGERFGADDNFAIHHGSFTEMLEVCGEGSVDGILLDLGVSSPQLDDAERGFSFMNDGPLDMRMNNSAGQSAAEWVAHTDVDDMANAFKLYGEERYAKRIARAIAERRIEKPFLRTADLAKVVQEAHPRWEKHKHPATRVFQAIRIAVNDELGDVESVLESAVRCLKQDGRLVVISFHSLEDRIVKRFIRDESRGPQLPKHVPVIALDTEGRLTQQGKAIKASKGELDQNVRSRSAVLRVASRTAKQ